MLSKQILSLAPDYIVDYDDSLGVDCDQSAADVAVFSVPCKCTVLYAGLAVTETMAGADSTPVVDFDSRATAGSDTGRGAADIAHLECSTTAAGKFLYDEAGQGEQLEPGEEVVVQLTTAASGTGKAGHFRPVLVVEPYAEMLENMTNAVETD